MNFFLTRGNDAAVCINLHLTCAGNTAKKAWQRALICDVAVTVQRVDGLKEAGLKSGLLQSSKKEPTIKKVIFSVSVAFAAIANIVPFDVNLPLKLPLLKDEAVQVQALPLLLTLAAGGCVCQQEVPPSCWISQWKKVMGQFLSAQGRNWLNVQLLKLPARKGTEVEHIWELPSIIIHHTTPSLLPPGSWNLLTGLRVLLKSLLHTAGNASSPKIQPHHLTPSVYNPSVACSSEEEN